MRRVARLSALCLSPPSFPRDYKNAATYYKNLTTNETRWAKAGDQARKELLNPFFFCPTRIESAQKPADPRSPQDHADFHISKIMAFFSFLGSWGVLTQERYKAQTLLRVFETLGLFSDPHLLKAIKHSNSVHVKMRGGECLHPSSPKTSAHVKEIYA